MNKVLLKDYLLLSKNEHEKLLEIRNKEYIREVSLNTSLIEFEDHLLFVKSLENSDEKFFAIIFQEKIIGGVNVFNINEDVKWGIFFLNNVSIVIKSIVPLYFLNYVFEKYNKDEIFLDVKKSNTNTISYDKNLGFEIFEEDDKMILMKMSKLKFEKAKENAFLKRVVNQMKRYSFEYREF